MRPGLLDAAPHIQAQDVVRALPDGVDLGVPQKPCHRPVFDVAVAAVDLDRIRGRGDAQPAYPELGDRHRDALAHAARLAMVGGAGAVEHHRLRRLDVDDQLGELAPHQRLVDQRAAERPALPRVTQRLDQGAARVAEPEQRDAQPRGVGQLHHPAQPLAVRRGAVGGLAGQQERLGVDELDLAGGHRAGAELVLQPAHPHPVAGTVAAGAQHQEVGHTTRIVRCPFGFGQYDERLPGAVGGEPLEAVEQPAVAVARRGGLQRAQVGAAGALGEQLRGFTGPLPGGELGQHVLAHIGGRVGGHQRLHHAAAGAQRAPHPDIGLVEQVIGREQRQRRAHLRRPRFGAQRLLGLQHGPLGLDEGRRHHHPADVVAPPVVALQPGRVAVGLLGPARHRAAHQLTDARQMPLGQRQLVGPQVVGHGELQRRIGVIPVETHGPAVVLGRVALGFLRGGKGQPIHRLDGVVAHR